jgi:hypothetical protein
MYAMKNMSGLDYIRRYDDGGTIDNSTSTTGNAVAPNLVNSSNDNSNVSALSQGLASGTQGSTSQPSTSNTISAATNPTNPSANPNVVSWNSYLNNLSNVDPNAGRRDTASSSDYMLGKGVSSIDFSKLAPGVAEELAFAEVHPQNLNMTWNTGENTGLGQYKSYLDYLTRDPDQVKRIASVYGTTKDLANSQYSPAMQDIIARGNVKGGNEIGEFIRNTANTGGVSTKEIRNYLSDPNTIAKMAVHPNWSTVTDPNAPLGSSANPTSAGIAAQNQQKAINLADKLMQEGYNPDTVKQYVFSHLPAGTADQKSISYAPSTGDYLASHIDAMSKGYAKYGMGTNTGLQPSRLNPLYRYTADPSLVGVNINNPQNADLSQYGNADLKKDSFNEYENQALSQIARISQPAALLKNKNVQDLNNHMKQKNYNIGQVLSLPKTPQTLSNIQKYRNMGFKI